MRGNRSAADCGSARAWLSARRDGETLGDDKRAQAHLERCEACAAWMQALDEVTRRVRVHVVEGPDVVSAALASCGGADPDRSRHRTGRILLAMAAVAGVTLSVLRLGPVSALGEHVSAHAGRELGSFEAAMAVGFAAAAWRPQRYVAGLLAVTAAVSVLTVLSSFSDLFNQRTDMAVEASHLPMLVGLVGLALVAPRSWRLDGTVISARSGHAQEATT